METIKTNVTRTAKPVRVMNRAPADIQITAEQIILEARDRGVAQRPPPPKQHIADTHELQEHRQRIRREFENKLRAQRSHVGIWLKYAKWEEEQKEIERARSIYERAVDVDYKNSAIWLRYAEMEMRNKFINRARNVWDRGVSLLPRVDTLWYKYTYMEEMLGNVNGARALFERWMEWEPAEQAWLSFIKLELRAGEIERARAVYEKYIACHPSQTAYIRYARWEERNGQKALARRIYERACDELRDDERDHTLLLAFAAFEVKSGENDRARAIFKYAQEHLPVEQAQLVQKEYIVFEKQHGDVNGVENVILTKRRAQYEEAVKENPLNYDAWFDYIRLEENEGSVVCVTYFSLHVTPDRRYRLLIQWYVQASAREVYERAVGNIPPVAEKRFWRRYVFLWINYALFEEMTAKDVGRTRQVYSTALKLVPHKLFTFAKLWLLAAHFEVRLSSNPGDRNTV
jgi:crooked neck